MEFIELAKGEKHSDQLLDCGIEHLCNNQIPSVKYSGKCIPLHRKAMGTDCPNVFEVPLHTLLSIISFEDKTF